MVNTPALIRSIDGINQFIDGKNIISTGKDFSQVYETIKKMLLEVGQERDTSYFSKRVTEYPEIHPVEIDEYLKERSGEKRIWFFLGGFILQFIRDLIVAAKSKGKSVKNIQPKLDKIYELNRNFISVLEKPGLEELIDKAG